MFADGSWSNPDTQTWCPDRAVRVGLQLEWEQVGPVSGQTNMEKQIKRPGVTVLVLVSGLTASTAS